MGAHKTDIETPPVRSPTDMIAAIPSQCYASSSSEVARVFFGLPDLADFCYCSQSSRYILCGRLLITLASLLCAWRETSLRRETDKNGWTWLPVSYLPTCLPLRFFTVRQIVGFTIAYEATSGVLVSS
ncbi:hypothetical protein E4U26_000474 [Claviceps purpurea]|nr:hypothetical protein E4U26_000474 [Claviceps purpurea]